MATLNDLFEKAPSKVEKKLSQKEREEEQWNFLQPLFREAIIFRNESVSVHVRGDVEGSSKTIFICPHKRLFKRVKVRAKSEYSFEWNGSSFKFTGNWKEENYPHNVEQLLSTSREQWNLSDDETIKYAIKFFVDTFDDFIDRFGMSNLTDYINKIDGGKDIYLNVFNVLPNKGLDYLKRVSKEDLVVEGAFWLPDFLFNEVFIIELYGDLDKQSFEDYGINILRKAPRFFAQKYKDDEMMYRMFERHNAWSLAWEMLQANIIEYRDIIIFHVLGLSGLTRIIHESPLKLYDYDINYTYKGQNILQQVFDDYRDAKESKVSIDDIVILLGKYVKAGSPFDLDIPDTYYNSSLNGRFKDLGISAECYFNKTNYSGENDQHSYSVRIYQYPFRKLIIALKNKLESDM